MPGNCDQLTAWLASEQQRQAQALDALNSATDSAKLAVTVLASASAAAAACNLLIENPPAYAICEGPALASVAVAEYACNYYNGKVKEAAQAYKDIGAAIETLNKLIDDCRVADENNQDTDVTQAIADGQSAFDAAEKVNIPDLSTQPLSDAQTKVAEADSADADAQQTATA